MPELPEVELARRNLVRWFEGRRVVGAEADKTRIFRGASPRAFEEIRGHLLKADRKGKYLMLAFERERGLVAHLGMTGKFVRRTQGQAEPYSRARFVLDDGHVIHFRDPRLFGRMEPCDADKLEQVPAVTALGLDALKDAPTGDRLRDALGHLSVGLKVALMDQARIAGLGNIHAAEALYRAKLHPARKPKTLTGAEWKRLAKAIQDTVRFALEREKSEEIQYVEEPGSDNPFLVYGRAGEKCRRCRTPIESFAQGGRTTYFCPHCQPRSRG
jgi:formamidopyrimidine-DNA glycosylase